MCFAYFYILFCLFFAFFSGFFFAFFSSSSSTGDEAVGKVVVQVYELMEDEGVICFVFSLFFA